MRKINAAKNDDQGNAPSGLPFNADGTAMEPSPGRTPGRRGGGGPAPPDSDRRLNAGRSR
jgi:hypothetical protein